MRFKHKDAELPRWAGATLVVLLFPLWGSFIGLLWLDEHARGLKRKLLGPRVGEWQRWFAWHPVRLDNGWGDTVWLEPVYRQAIGSSYSYGIAYVLEEPA